MAKAPVADKMMSWAQSEGEVKAIEALWGSFDDNRRILDVTTPTPPWPPMCCWEMPILAALLTRNLSKEAATILYDGVVKTNGAKLAPLVSSSKTYKGPAADKGDLIFFTSKQEGELAHVALATGESIGGEAVILSFWAIEVMMLDVNYKEALKANQSPDLGLMTTKLKTLQKNGSPARVTMTTIEAMKNAIGVLMQSPPGVVSGVPVWA